MGGVMGYVVPPLPPELRSHESRYSPPPAVTAGSGRVAEIIVCTIGLILACFNVEPPWDKRLKWALGVLVCAPVAGAIYLLTRQRERRRVPYHLDTADHGRVDAEIEDIDDEIEAIDEAIDSGERGYFDGGDLGADMAKRLAAEKD